MSHCDGRKPTVRYDGDAETLGDGVELPSFAPMSVAVPAPRFVRAQPASRSRGPPPAPTRPPHPPRSPAYPLTPSAGTGRNTRKSRMSILSMVRGSDHVPPRCTSRAAPPSPIALRCRATTAPPRRVAIAENRRSDPPGPALHHLTRGLASAAPIDYLTGLTCNEVVAVLEQVEKFFLSVTARLWLGGKILSPAAVTGLHTAAEKFRCPRCRPTSSAACPGPA